MPCLCLSLSSFASRNYKFGIIFVRLFSSERKKPREEKIMKKDGEAKNHNFSTRNWLYIFGNERAFKLIHKHRWPREYHTANVGADYTVPTAPLYTTISYGVVGPTTTRIEYNMWCQRCNTLYVSSFSPSSSPSSFTNLRAEYTLVCDEETQHSVKWVCCIAE